MSNITVDITENITQVTATINETTQAVTVEVTTSGAQPTNANLTALSGLTGAADKAPYFTGVGAMALATLTGYGRSIIALADRAGLLALLGLTTADIPQDSTHRMVSDTQTASWDAKQSALGFTPEDVANKQTDLTASATKYPTVNAVVAGDTATLAAAEIYSANPANVTQDASHRFATDAEKTAWNGKQSALGYTPANTASNLSDLVSASSARTNLGLGSLATQSGTFSGTSSGTNTGDETGARIATLAHAATAKTTLVDADEIAGTDSASSYSLIRTTMSNIWTYIKSKADAVYVTSGGALGTPSSGTLTNCTFPTLNQNTTGSAATLTTARTIDGVSFDGGSNITVIAPGTHAATSKATPVDADELALVDSAASNVLKKLTWANLKATLKAYFDTLYNYPIYNFVSGYYYTFTSPPADTTASPGASILIGGAYFNVSSAASFDRIGVEITTNVAASTVRLGIYNVTKLLPTTLVLDAGTVDSTTTGVKQITISQALPAGMYLLVAAQQGGGSSVAMRARNGGYGIPPPATTISNANYTAFSTAAAGALPSSPTWTLSQSAAPKVMVRAV